jgi:hypothetical protein
LPILHLLDVVFNIPKWNAKVDNYVASIFGFVDKYLTRDGCIFFFYNDDFRVLKNIKSYLENYHFKIHFKICNSQQNASNKFQILDEKGKHFLNSTKVSYDLHELNTNILLCMSQILLSRALLIVYENGIFSFPRDL